MMGCIPVVFQDHVYQTAENVIPYRQFSIRMTEQDIPLLDEILEAIPEETVKELQMGLKKWHSIFLWNPANGGLAYNATLESIAQSIQNLHSNYGRRRQSLQLRMPGEIEQGGAEAAAESEVLGWEGAAEDIGSGGGFRDSD